MQPFLRFIFCVSFIAVSSASYAQINFRNENLGDLLDILTARYGYNKDQPIDLEGTPYLKNEFQYGDIVYVNRMYASHLKVPVRYNIFEDEIEYYQEEEDRVMTLKRVPQVEKVILNDQVFVFRKYVVGKKPTEGYFQLIEDGKVSLLGKMRVKFHKAQPPKALQDPVPAKFTSEQTHYYVELSGGTLFKITSMKKLISVLRSHEEELKEFVKRERTSPGNPDELLNFIEYYNSLENSGN